MFERPSQEFHQSQNIICTRNSITRRCRAWALSKAIDWIRHLHLYNVVFELNYKMVYGSFNKCSKGVSDFDLIINRCRTDFRFSSNSRMSFVKTQVNLKHNFNRASRFYVRSHKFYYISSCIVSNLMNEMLYLSFPKKNKKKNFTKVNYERNFLIYISLIIFYTSFKYYHWCFTNSMNLDQLMHISYMKPDKDSQ